jgi:predicted ATPase/serine phosphatase RsbU (regulator of sigma subunit)
MLKEDYPTPAELTRYRQEYEITHDLDLVGVIKVYDIEKYQNTLVIILEDFGGDSLKQLMTARPLAVKEFLPFAIQIADSLGNIHAANIIHKDINPSNIVWEPISKQLKIIDFGIASRLPRENPTLKNPEQLEGTLAYLSPEQTGRINRSMDYRTDLYSLGVTCYEILTGKLPFTTTDAMELVHCHIAKTFSPVCEVNPDIPPIVSDIVMKLLAKNAEDRYQSAFGLKADLEKCLALTKKVFGNKLFSAHFELAQNDFSGQFQIPQKLYGRSNEVNTLLQAFERVSNGKTEMMLVAGYSGVGKTALVHEVHKPMTEKRGYFTVGKFDQFQKNIPYYAVTQAFNEFCRYLLTVRPETLANWQNKILEAVGNNGQIIIDVIPDLELVIGKQPVVAEVGPTEAQNRFQMFFLNFVKVLSDKEHPFILFIDDLQWVDSASLDLLKSIMLDDEIQYLLIIGAYRDNEVDNSHPFIMAVNELQKANVVINTIELTNLQPEDVNHLLQESLFSETLLTQSLTDLIYQKTQGNAFFTRQFLRILYEDTLLRFDFTKHEWIWDIKQIAAQNITDNVVELMASKIDKLSKKTITILRLAACIGNQFDLSMLTIIYEQDKKETLATLWEAIAEGLIQPLDDNYKHADLPHSFLSKEGREGWCEEAFFKFLHDRVQQAAYSRINNDEKQITHLKIGRLLLANTSEVEQSKKIFDLLGHLNLSRVLITDNQEKLRLADLNLMAGKKAKISGNYQTAIDCFVVGMELLLVDSWEQQHALSFEIYKERAECEYLNGHFENADKLFNVALAKAESNLEKAEIFSTLVILYASKADLDKAVESGINGLKLCGVNIAENADALKIQIDSEFERIKIYRTDKKIEDLINLPALTDSIKFTAMQLCMNMLPTSYMSGNLDLYTFITLQMVNISLDFGNSSISSHGYVTYGAILTIAFDDYNTGYQFGKLGLKLSDNYNNTLIEGKNGLAFAGFVSSWKEHARNSVDYLHAAFLQCVETGDISYAGYIRLNAIYFQILSGAMLEGFYQESIETFQFIKKTNDQTSLNCCLVFNQWISCLRGETRGKYDLSDERFNWDEEIRKVKEASNYNVLYYHLTASLQLSFTYGDFEKALDSANQMLPILDSAGGTLSYTNFYFYYSLALIACFPSFSQEDQVEARKTLESNLAKIELWMNNCPENFQHFYLLVSAEMAKLEERVQEAITLYDKAIQAAHNNGYIHHEALANELAALFCQSNSWEKFTKVYLQEAYYLYTRWGATAKVLDLEEKYSQLLVIRDFKMPESTITTSATIMASATTQLKASTLLDLTTVLKASQTLAAEIVLSRLLEKMMNTLIENAGAERGLLIFEKEKENRSEDNKNNIEWVIEAEGTLNQENIAVLHSLPIDGYLPIAIINYVVRSCEPLVLANATREGIYSKDSYIRQHQLKSILCSPILHQGQLIGLLYLENNLIEGAFTPARLKIVDMLSSQAAISLENALLYRTLEQKVEQRTIQLATANQEITEANQEITILNERLKEENLRMGAELDVAKQLQQMVLPKEEELQQIENLDIAGFMEPADEIGGDYYDVLEHNGRIKIGIGDVTGHGLESGVLMLMVQMGVQTLLTTDIRDSEKFLTLLNHAVHKNIKRIQTDKNLTLSLLDYQSSTGILRITGQHEDVLIVRQGGKIERIDTVDLGFMVGVIPNIAKFVSHLDIQLLKGDGIVLYTDGITEARNPKMELYEMERLCKVVSQNWHLTAKEIQQAIVADVKKYIDTQKVFDDITLLVLKQK